MTSTSLPANPPAVAVDSTADFGECAEALVPQPDVRLVAWSRRHYRTHEGKPFDLGRYPHVAAPGGPMDAFDDPAVREIVLQWASRTGKTIFSQCAFEKTADVAPAPMMLASSSRSVALDITKRTYASLAHCPRLADRLPPPHLRKQDVIDLGACQVLVGWSRSKSSLADKDVRVGHANELDKWEHISTSSEADPLKLFLDRFKSFAATRKTILESTPTLKGSSRIEDLLHASSHCRYYVPCPYCGRYQTLEMGKRYHELRGIAAPDHSGGLVWETPATGRDDVHVARQTARYQCRHCDGHIRDEHRAVMMRRGIWVPTGCTVVDEAAAAEVALDPEARAWRGWSRASWVAGEPLRDGPSAGYQLSSLYSLSLSWGDVAAEFIESVHRAQFLRNYVNQWLAETWEIVARGQSWEQLGAKLIQPDCPRGHVPPGFSLVTVGIDRQQDHFVFLVDAWGPERQSHTVDYGTCEDFDDLVNEVLGVRYKFQDDAGGLTSACALIDSGYKPADVYEFCRQQAARGMAVLPCKGASSSLFTAFRVSVLAKGTSSPGQKIVRVDSEVTQDVIDRALHQLRPGDAGGVSLYAAPLNEHRDFLEQLLNEAPVPKTDARNYERLSYQRIDPSIPNDYRDAKRYAYVAMLIATRGRALKPREVAADHARGARDEQPKPKIRRSTWYNPRPDGWIG